MCIVRTGQTLNGSFTPSDATGLPGTFSLYLIRSVSWTALHFIRTWRHVHVPVVKSKPHATCNRPKIQSFLPPCFGMFISSQQGCFSQSHPLGRLPTPENCPAKAWRPFFSLFFMPGDKYTVPDCVCHGPDELGWPDRAEIEAWRPTRLTCLIGKWLRRRGGGRCRAPASRARYREDSGMMRAERTMPGLDWACVGSWVCRFE